MSCGARRRGIEARGFSSLDSGHCETCAAAGVGGQAVGSRQNAVNPVTGKPSRRDGDTRRRRWRIARRCCAVSTTFTGRPAPGRSLNPFPLALPAAGGRTRITTRWIRSARQRAARTGRGCRRGSLGQIPDERFNELFAGWRRDRDRALVAFWISTGARASELLGAPCDIDPGQQLITVVRKGSRAMQQLPASADAFVWLRLYQAADCTAWSRGPDAAAWWTLRRPFRPLTYHAAHRDVRARQRRAGGELDAARPAARGGLPDGPDPQLPLTDVQWVLGHALADHHRAVPDPDAGRGHRAGCWPITRAPPSPRGTRQPARWVTGPESLDVLFGQEAAMTIRRSHRHGAATARAGGPAANAGSCRRSSRPGPSRPLAEHRRTGRHAARLRSSRSSPEFQQVSAAGRRSGSCDWLELIPGRQLAAAVGGQRRRAATGRDWLEPPARDLDGAGRASRRDDVRTGAGHRACSADLRGLSAPVAGLAGGHLCTRGSADVMAASAIPTGSPGCALAPAGQRGGPKRPPSPRSRGSR